MTMAIAVPEYKRIHGITVEEFKNTVDQGDILLIGGDGSWLSNAICKATGHWASHVAMSMGAEFIAHVTFPEARVSQDKITEWLNVRRVMILRHKDQTTVQRVRRALWMATLSGMNYNVPSLFWWVAAKILPSWLVGSKNWLYFSHPVCSNGVAYALLMNEARQNDAMLNGTNAVNFKMPEYIFWNRHYSTIAPRDFDGNEFLYVVADIPGKNRSFSPVEEGVQ